MKTWIWLAVALSLSACSTKKVPPVDAGPVVDAGPARCEANTRGCEGNTPRTCVDGTWQPQAACAGALSLCSFGVCVCADGTGGACADAGPGPQPQCFAGTRGCLNATTPEACVDGGWAPLAACAAPQGTCSSGACVCADGSQTSCVDAGPGPQPQCFAGTRGCLNATTPEQCSDGGWVPLAVCGGDAPSCSFGVCACTEGARDCVGATPRLCTGGAWTALASCGGDLPSCSQGVCECTDGGVSCQGNTPLRCVGHTFVPLAACGGATPTCAQGACVCTDGAMTCADATTPQVCTGGVQVAQAACPPNTPACQQGACACAEGALSCAGNTPQLCAAGVLLPQAACPTRTLCALGDCVVPQTFSAGSQSTCAVLGGKVECWGDNSNGQLGDGTYSPHALPTELPFFQGVSVLHVGTSGEHSCAVEADGTVLCWGYNGYGQLGDGTTTSHTAPVAAAGVTSAVEVAVGDYSTCALRSDGTVLCWGSNSNGQLGNNTLVSSSVPVAVPHLTQVTQVQAGGSDYCAVKQDHSVWCWGYSYFGQTGSLTNPQLVPTPVAGLEATEVALGLQTSCALSTDAGEVDCWGYGQQGQLGISPALFQQPVPQPVGLRDAVAVAVGTSHVCAAKSDGTVWCWGDNSAGQLGDGTTAAHNVPAQVPGLQGIVALSSHASHTCAQDTAGALHCWGDDQKGQLGDGLTSARFQATAVLGLSGASAVSAGGNFTCALLADGGDVQCWGTDRDNELGDFSYQNRAVPGPVPGLVGVAQLAAGGNHACARLSDGSVQCWGGNSASQLADSTIGAPVTGVAGASSVAASTSKTIYSYSSSSSGCYDDCGASCAVSAGLVQCWGDNRFGQIGNGSFGTSNVPPTAVLGVSGVTQVVLGAQHGCALTGAGTVSCWGDNTYGQLGDGTLASRAAAGQVPSLSGVVALSAGDVHTCALLTDQTVQCWGNNDYGQLGSFNYSLSPLPVDALTGAVEVAAGARHTCARLSDGTVSCWGTNTSGQLGNVLSSFSAATPVTGLTTATQITAGGFTDQYTDVGSQGHACALLADTTVWCWGLDSSGQVGDGLFGYRATPVDVIVH